MLSVRPPEELLSPRPKTSVTAHTSQTTSMSMLPDVLLFQHHAYFIGSQVAECFNNGKAPFDKLKDVTVFGAESDDPLMSSEERRKNGVKAHKVILAMFSGYFAEVLSDLDAQEDTMFAPLVTSNHLKILITMMYNGILNLSTVPVDDWLGLLQAAKELRIDLTKLNSVSNVNIEDLIRGKCAQIGEGGGYDQCLDINDQEDICIPSLQDKDYEMSLDLATEHQEEMSRMHIRQKSKGKMKGKQKLRTQNIRNPSLEKEIFRNLGSLQPCQSVNLAPSSSFSVSSLSSTIVFELAQQAMRNLEPINSCVSSTISLDPLPLKNEIFAQSSQESDRDVSKDKKVLSCPSNKSSIGENPLEPKFQSYSHQIIQFESNSSQKDSVLSKINDEEERLQSIPKYEHKNEVGSLNRELQLEEYETFHQASQSEMTVHLEEKEDEFRIEPGKSTPNLQENKLSLSAIKSDSVEINEDFAKKPCSSFPNHDSNIKCEGEKGIQVILGSELQSVSNVAAWVDATGNSLGKPEAAVEKSHVEAKSNRNDADINLPKSPRLEKEKLERYTKLDEKSRLIQRRRDKDGSIKPAKNESRSHHQREEKYGLSYRNDTDRCRSRTRETSHRRDFQDTEKTSSKRSHSITSSYKEPSEKKHRSEADRNSREAPFDLKAKEVKYSKNGADFSHLAGQKCPTKRIPPQGYPPTACELCDLYFPYIGAKQWHDLEHHKIGFKCEACDQIFQNHEERSQHLSTVHPLQCQTCEKRFAKQDTLNKHMRVVHRLESDEKKESDDDGNCQKCGQKFSTANAKRIHLKVVHKLKEEEIEGQEKETTKCQTESVDETDSKKFSFSRRNSIVSWQSRFNSELVQNCQDCGQCWKFNLARPWHDCLPNQTCRLCKRYFTKISDLRIHLKLCHLTVRACRMCGEVTSNRENASAHMVYHEQSKGKTRKCDFCERKYHTEAAEYQHFLSVHFNTLLRKYQEGKK